MVSRYQTPSEQEANSAGVPYAAGKLAFYITGTSTPTDTYPDATLNPATANTNPVVLNSRGEPPNGIWMTTGTAYDLVLSPPGDTDPPTNPIWTQLSIKGV